MSHEAGRGASGAGGKAAMTTSAGVPIIRANGEGEKRWWLGGGVHTWKATVEETGGAFLLFEDLMGRGKTTPEHCHPEVDETLYVLDGEILVRVGDHDHRVSAGGTVMAPRGMPHAFVVTSETARMLCLQTPGDARAEAFFRDGSEPAAADVDVSGPVDFALVQQSAKDSGATVILGPPHFDEMT